MTGATDTLLALFRPLETLTAAETTVTPLWAGGPAPASAAVTATPTRAALRAAPRAYLLLGEGVTPRGAGRLVRDALLPDALTTPAEIRAADDATLGAAVFALAMATTFGTAQTLTLDQADRRWRVGTLLALPAWATDAGGVRTWHVDAAALVTTIATVPAAPTAIPLRRVGTEPTRLLAGSDTVDGYARGGADRVDDAVAGRAALVAAVAGAGYDPAAEGRRLAAESLWNPYDVLFELLETAQVLAAGPAAAFAAAYWDALTPPERVVLNGTSAGHAWLRSLWRWWGRAAGIASLRTTLGLTNDDLAVRAPSNLGDLEPPMPGVTALPVCSPATKGDPLPVMALGRRVRFLGAQYPKEASTYFGLSHPGTVPPPDYLRRIPAPIVPPDAFVPPGATAAQRAVAGEQYARILSAISRTEGNLDAAAAWDRAACSLGFQQWSMHVPTEGTALLERLKRLAPAYHDLLLGSLGVETGTVAAGAPSSTGAAVADLAAPRCFYLLSPTVAPVPHVPDDDGPGTRRLRADVFDWVPIPVTAKVTHWRVGRRAALLAARWVVASRFVLEIWQAQSDLATHRIVQTAVRLRSTAESARWTPVLGLTNAPKGTPVDPVTPLTLFGTEALLGLVVDMVINTPEHATSAMRRAVLRALAAAHDPAQPTASVPLDDDLRVRLVLAFLAERHYFGAVVSKVVTTTRGGAIDVAPARVKVLLRGLGNASALLPATLPADLSAALRSARIPDEEQLSWTRPVPWP